MSKHFEHCDHCDHLVPVSRLQAVQVCRATMSSPAEYEQWCQDCIGPERDEAYERAAARYDGEGKDWR
jgi:hypothetical protein